MKALFSALHHAYFRNFESVVRELAARGHQVHLAADEPEDLGGQELAERLARECPDLVTWGFSPSLEHEPWFETARKLRQGLDYARMMQPRYSASPKLRVRAESRAPRIVRWAARTPRVGPRLALATLTRLERLLPRAEAMVEYLRAHAPDIVVLASLTYSRSQQLDMLKAARVLDIPVAAAIMSWDHLSSKALLHIAPDMVLVWNEMQKHEAIDMHGLPSDRIVTTGAQCYDQWFARSPHRSREEFCRAMGLRADRPFALWVHSTFSPAPEVPESTLVTQWIEALRSSSDPCLRDLGVLVRPHPERIKEWAGVDLARYENVAFHGRNPIDVDAKNDYFDSLYHSSAVIGLVTSAFLEAAIVGRSVLTLILPAYRMHQQEMLHFRYLMEVEGGLLHAASDMETHLTLLSTAVAGRGRDQRNRRFLQAFVRPSGLDVPATPVFADALERLQREGARADPSLESASWVRGLVGALAGQTHWRIGRWLLNDPREDAWDADRERKQEFWDERHRAKVDRERHRHADREARLRRHHAVQRRKGLARAWRRGRHSMKMVVLSVLQKSRPSRDAVRRLFAFAGMRRSGR